MTDYKFIIIHFDIVLNILFLRKTDLQLCRFFVFVECRIASLVVFAMASDSISDVTAPVIICTVGLPVFSDKSISARISAVEFIPACALVISESSRVRNIFLAPVTQASLLRLAYYRMC